MDSPKFASFAVSRAIYKTVSSSPIAAYILIPKASSSPDSSKSKHPIIVRFHGGFLVTGSGIYAEWVPEWFLSYALLHNAIIVSPNHRLLPESNGLDILSDIADFWTWLATEFPSYLATNAPNVEADLSHILAVGESAGGYLAVMSALNQPPSAPYSIRAVIGAYPMLDLSDDWYTKAGEKPMFGAPQIPPAVLSSHLEAIKTGAAPVPVSEVEPPARLPLALSMVQQGLWTSILGTDTRLLPFSVLEKMDRGRGAVQVPKMFLFHGLQDSAVPFRGTVKFAELAKAKFGADTVEVYTGPGDHGFDAEASLETPWLKEGLAKMTSEWI